jgi:methylated-DNA-[protein]-cysteine S-methyltransferase
MKHHEYVHRRVFPLVGGLELRTSDAGVQALTFIPRLTDVTESASNHVMRILLDELERYFAGELRVFTVPLDPTGGTAFQRSVWSALQEIPYGTTKSYQDIAGQIGKPTATRAVGSANGRNPIPIIIPCHRVIKADGTLGGYSSGIEIKKALLGLEGSAV